MQKFKYRSIYSFRRTSSYKKLGSTTNYYVSINLEILGSTTTCGPQVFKFCAASSLLMADNHFSTLKSREPTLKFCEKKTFLHFLFFFQINFSPKISQTLKSFASFVVFPTPVKVFDIDLFQMVGG